MEWGSRAERELQCVVPGRAAGLLVETHGPTTDQEDIGRGESQTRTRWVLRSSAIAAVILAYPCIAQETLKIGSTGAALGSLKLLAAAFERSHVGTKVEVLSSLGSSGAIQAFRKGAIDLAISGRTLSNEEEKQGLSLVEYARTPFMPVAERSVGQSNLTADALLRIYRGESAVWPNGARIRLVLRVASDTDNAILRGISPEMSVSVDIALAREGMQIAITDQDNAQMIARTPGAIGFVSLTQYTTENLSLKVLAYDGITPSLSALLDGSYPLCKSFGYVMGPASSPKSREFIAFIRSAEGRRILEQSGCLSVGRD
jgi:phosphate transport system substrate-binding protein